jgi:cytochrome c peroxidase
VRSPRSNSTLAREVRRFGWTLLGLAVALPAWADPEQTTARSSLDRALALKLQEAGFTGLIESTLESRLGRPLDRNLADLGRLVYFDEIQGLHGDNSCAGCHTPGFGFGDSQSIAIGVDNNRIVGPDRAGPRNLRKAPPVVNSAFFPKQMLNGRFVALSGDPFDNSMGFQFPAPEGTTRFPANDPEIRTLLAAQGHIPQTELVEMAGFTGTAGTIGPLFDPFDDGHGSTLPPADASGFRNEPIRSMVLDRFNAEPAYRALFGSLFNGGVPFPPGGITFSMVARAIAEFQISLTFADAPIDRFARGQTRAMSPSQKRGALLFFGKARCVECHAVAGAANEMFSDFENHVLGVPQIAPVFGLGTGDVLFDGPGSDEDFGAEQVSGDPDDRYAFRTSPLRGVAVQPAFFHNGAFVSLEDAIRHHLDAAASSAAYDPEAAGVDADLCLRRGPAAPVLARLDPRVQAPIVLTKKEFKDLVEFVREGLLDPRILPENLCALLPASVPSGRPVATFQGCESCAAAPAGKRRAVVLGTAGELQVWPNPAAGAVLVSFALGSPAAVRLEVFDAAGRRVRRLAEPGAVPGLRTIAWDGRDEAGEAVARGVYLVRLVSSEGSITRRVTILR